MKATIPMLIVLVFVSMNSVSAGQQKTNVAQTVNQLENDLASLNKSHQTYREAAEKLAGLYSDLSKKVDGVVKMSGAAAPGKADASAFANLQAAIKDLQQTQMSFNQQYLQLQQQMQNENRQYTTVSNVMKTKHDTVKNSINNVR